MQKIHLCGELEEGHPRSKWEDHEMRESFGALGTERKTMHRNKDAKAGSPVVLIPILESLNL